VKSPIDGMDLQIFRVIFLQFISGFFATRKLNSFFLPTWLHGLGLGRMYCILRQAKFTTSRQSSPTTDIQSPHRSIISSFSP
jgi:hypothetical protein